MLDISLSRPAAWNALGAAWRELEARSSASFFQSWSWVGCRAAARFPDPLLLEVRAADITIALGLFNRRHHFPAGRRLWLNETGIPAIDSIFVEHNGLLLAADAPPGVVQAALAHLARAAVPVVLSGVDQAHLAAAHASGALVRARAHASVAPFIDLAAVRAHAEGHLGLLSANGRAQIRRSLRRYATTGALRVHRATSLEQARAFLAALGVLHQRAWTRRGQPGAFANLEFVAYHNELLITAWPRGEIDLLRVDVGATPIGYLYNFRWRDQAANYQSGFDYDAAESPQQKPGLTCHHLAAEMYADEGLAAYDLLAGEHRYKTTLATGTTELHWIEMVPPNSLPGLLHRARKALTGT